MGTALWHALHKAAQLQAMERSVHAHGEPKFRREKQLLYIELGCANVVTWDKKIFFQFFNFMTLINKKGDTNVKTCVRLVGCNILFHPNPGEERCTPGTCKRFCAMEAKSCYV